MAESCFGTTAAPLLGPNLQQQSRDGAAGKDAAGLLCLSAVPLTLTLGLLYLTAAEGREQRNTVWREWRAMKQFAGFPLRQ